MGIEAFGIGHRDPSPADGFFDAPLVFQMGNETDARFFGDLQPQLHAFPSFQSMIWIPSF